MSYSPILSCSTQRWSAPISPWRLFKPFCQQEECSKSQDLLPCCFLTTSLQLLDGDREDCCFIDVAPAAGFGRGSGCRGCGSPQNVPLWKGAAPPLELRFLWVLFLKLPWLGLNNNNKNNPACGLRRSFMAQNASIPNQSRAVLKEADAFKWRRMGECLHLSLVVSGGCNASRWWILL